MGLVRFASWCVEGPAPVLSCSRFHKLQHDIGKVTDVPWTPRGTNSFSAVGLTVLPFHPQTLFVLLVNGKLTTNYVTWILFEFLVSHIRKPPNLNSSKEKKHAVFQNVILQKYIYFWLYLKNSHLMQYDEHSDTGCNTKSHHYEVSGPTC